MPEKSAFPLLISLAFLTVACGTLNSPGITLQVLNRDAYFITGDLEIKTCITDSRMPVHFSALAVNIYVTENEGWRAHPAGLPPYTDYINPALVGIPGTRSEPVSENLWYPLGGGCYQAKLAGAFVDTGDWSQVGLCPFNAVVLVAAYGRGSRNAAQVILCEV